MKILILEYSKNFDVFLEVAKAINETHKIVILTSCAQKNIECLNNGVDSVFLSNSIKGQRLEGGRLEGTDWALSTKKDRLLRWYPTVVRKWLIENLYKRITHVISVDCPDLVIGEVSWAVEDLVADYCERRSIPYRHILNLPTAPCRLVAFDKSHSYHSLIESSNVQQLTKSSVNEEVDAGISYDELSCRVKRLQARQPARPFFARLLGLSHRIQDGTKDYRYNFVLWRINQFLSFFNLLWVTALLNIKGYVQEVDASARSVFFALHIQPESTPDYLVSEVVDQFEIAVKLSAVSGRHTNIYIKDHPNRRSTRPLRGLVAALLAPNVKILPRNFSSAKLIEEVDYIASVGGTVTWEALAASKPAIVASPIFYSEVEGVFSLDEMARASERSAKVDPVKGWLSLKRVVDRCPIGFIHDPLLQPEVMSLSNIAAIAEFISGLALSLSGEHEVV